MSVKFEDLEILQIAENVADDLWNEIISWHDFEKDTVGKQLVRAVDSIGANIAEAYGRFHFGEKLQFFYYARGSLFETKYRLNRGFARQLISAEKLQKHNDALSQLAYKLIILAKKTKQQRTPKGGNAVRETKPIYATIDTVLDNFINNDETEFFTLDEINHLRELPKLPNYPIT